MTYETIYKEIRRELVCDIARIQTLRSWALALAGGAAAFMIRELPVRVTECTSEGTFDLSSLIIAAAALLSLAFWYAAQVISRGIARMGFFLLMIEYREGLGLGWEHMVWLGEAKGLRPISDKFFGEVNFWILLSFSSVSMAFLCLDLTILTLLSFAVSILCFIVGIVLRKSTCRFRAKVYSDYMPLFSLQEWHSEIGKYYGKTFPDFAQDSPDGT